MEHVLGHWTRFGTLGTRVLNGQRPSFSWWLLSFFFCRYIPLNLNNESKGSTSKIRFSATLRASGHILGHLPCLSSVWLTRIELIITEFQSMLAWFSLQKAWISSRRTLSLFSKKDALNIMNFGYIHFQCHVKVNGILFAQILRCKATSFQILSWKQVTDNVILQDFPGLFQWDSSSGISFFFVSFPFLEPPRVIGRRIFLRPHTRFSFLFFSFFF